MDFYGAFPLFDAEIGIDTLADFVAFPVSLNADCCHRSQRQGLNEKWYLAKLGIRTQSLPVLFLDNIDHLLFRYCWQYVMVVICLFFDQSFLMLYEPIPIDLVKLIHFVADFLHNFAFSAWIAFPDDVLLMDKLKK